MTAQQQPQLPDRKALLYAAGLLSILLFVLAVMGCHTGRRVQTTVVVDTTLQETITVSLPVLPHQLEGSVSVGQLYSLAPGDSISLKDTTGPATGNIVVKWEPDGQVLGIVARVDTFWIRDTVYYTKTLRIEAKCPPVRPEKAEQQTPPPAAKKKPAASWWRGVGRSWMLVLILMPWSLLIGGAYMLYRGFKAKPPTTNYPTE